MTIPHEGGSTGILVLRDDDHDDVLVLDRLRSDPSIEFVDRFAEQLAGVRRLGGRLGHSYDAGLGR